MASERQRKANNAATDCNSRRQTAYFCGTASFERHCVCEVTELEMSESSLDAHPHPQTSSANSDISDSLTSCVVKNSCLENLTLSLFFGNRHSEDQLWKTCLLRFSFVCLSALTYLISGLCCIPRYVTSAYIDLSPEAREQQENAGCVFRVTGHGARGLPPHRYGKIEPKARL